MFSIKKGAMFGLDARIALAIFGALSVISGAALYSAISAANLEFYKQEFVELEKALEHYYLENGQQLEQSGCCRANIVDLVKNDDSLSTWNGPYINGKQFFTSSSIRNAITDKLGIATDGNSRSEVFSITLKQRDTWADPLASSCTTGNINCAQYFTIKTEADAELIATRNLFNDLDKVYDGADGGNAGKIRFREATSAIGFFYYKTLSRVAK